MLFLSAMLLSAGADPVAIARKAYSDCLINFVIADLENGVPADKHAEAIKQACPTERDAMAAAIVKQERSYGSSAKEAQDYAAEEVHIEIAANTDRYPDYVASKTQPEKPK